VELLIGAFLGVVFERVTKVFQNLFFTVSHWSIAGEYTHGSGVVNIRRGFGNRFITQSKESDSTYNWRGSFQFDDTYMLTGRGAYRYIERENDWGHHYIMLLENGDISVQWENMSAGNRNHGALIWYKRR
jgi:hypothetical protein